MAEIYFNNVKIGEVGKRISYWQNSTYVRDTYPLGLISLWRDWGVSFRALVMGAFVLETDAQPPVDEQGRTPWVSKELFRY